MLRASAKQSVFEALDESYFGASNFTIEYGNGEPLWVRISFIPNSTFQFTIHRSALGSAFYQSSEAPGVKLLRAESHMTQTFEELVQRIPAWVVRIKEEVIDANPIARELQDVRKKLEERIDLLAEGQEEFFTAEEARELSGRLEEFVTQLQAMAQQNEELKATVQGLKSRLEELGTAASAVNKGTWLRMAASRLMQGTKAVLGSKEARELALEAAKKLLLEGPK
jgi:predicted RNase H-like nuclease (RuvC/YqgF family)